MTHPTTPLDQAKALFASEDLVSAAARGSPRSGCSHKVNICSRPSVERLALHAGTLQHGAARHADPRGLRPDRFLDGYGMNSWALHYFLVQPGIALSFSCPGAAPTRCRRRSQHHHRHLAVGAEYAGQSGAGAA